MDLWPTQSLHRMVGSPRPQAKWFQFTHEYCEPARATDPQPLSPGQSESASDGLGPRPRPPSPEGATPAPPHRTIAPDKAILPPCWRHGDGVFPAKGAAKPGQRNSRRRARAHLTPIPTRCARAVFPSPVSPVFRSPRPVVIVPKTNGFFAARFQGSIRAQSVLSQEVRAGRERPYAQTRIIGKLPQRMVGARRNVTTRSIDQLGTPPARVTLRIIPPIPHDEDGRALLVVLSLVEIKAWAHVLGRGDPSQADSQEKKIPHSPFPGIPQIVGIFRAPQYPDG